MDGKVAGLMLVHLSQWNTRGTHLALGLLLGADVDADGGGNLVGSLDDMPTGSLRQVRREILANGYINTFNVTRYCLTLKSLLFNSSSSLSSFFIFCSHTHLRFAE